MKWTLWLAAAVLASLLAAPGGGWLGFEAADQYARAAHPAELDLPVTPGGSLTVEGWFQLSRRAPALGSYQAYLLQKYQGYGLSVGRSCLGYPLECQDVVSMWQGNSGISLPLGQALAAEEWHHLAWVRDGPAGQSRVYYDGAPLGSAASLPAAAQPGELFLGCMDAACTGSGSLMLALDEVRISDTARYSAAFEPPARLSCDAHTRALWHFDEPGGGTAFHDSCGTVDDALAGMNGAQIRGGPAPFRIFHPLLRR